MQTHYNLFRTKDNFYAYIPNSMQFLLIHPLMFYLLKQNKEGVDIDKWIKSRSGRNVEIDGVGSFLKKDIKYQYNKMQFFLTKIFDKHTGDVKLIKYTGEDIKKYMANTEGITFEVTEHCNLACDYCVYGKYYINQQNAIEKILTFEIAKNMLDFFVPIWESSLNNSFNNKIMIGFYGGEALLNFNLIEKIVTYVKSLSISSKDHVEFTMTTNGVLLDKYIPFLVENNFTIKISLDGGTEKENSFRKYHSGKIAFDKIYSNVLKIKDKYPSFFEKNVHFLSVLHRNNSESKIVDFFSNRLNKEAFMSALATDNLNPDFETEFWETINPSLEPAEKISLQNMNNLDTHDVDRFIRHFCCYVKSSYLSLLASNRKEKAYLPTGTCMPFKRIIFVTSDGKILACERIGHQFILGQITATDVNIDFDEIADTYNDCYTAIFEQCKKCVFKLACSQCMFQTNNFNCQDFLEDSTENYAQFFAHYFSAMENNPKLYLESTKYKSI